MKKLLIFFSVVLITFMISCSDQNYYDEMESLDPPEQHDVMFNKTVWMTHKMDLNENEILYFAPRSFNYDDKFYLNKDEQYYIYTIDPDVFMISQYRIADRDDLQEIFG